MTSISSFFRALFIKPHLLLMDEPTNHLDLEACVWLEEELKTYKNILVLISHSQVTSGRSKCVYRAGRPICRKILLYFFHVSFEGLPGQ